MFYFLLLAGLVRRKNEFEEFHPSISILCRMRTKENEIEESNSILQYMYIYLHIYIYHVYKGLSGDLAREV